MRDQLKPIKPKHCKCWRPTINDMSYIVDNSDPTINRYKRNVVCTTCWSHHFDGVEYTAEEWDKYINEED